jgi:hypothetical protein
MQNQESSLALFHWERYVWFYVFRVLSVYFLIAARYGKFHLYFSCVICTFLDRCKIWQISSLVNIAWSIRICMERVSELLLSAKRAICPDQHPSLWSTNKGWLIRSRVYISWLSYMSTCLLWCEWGSNVDILFKSEWVAVKR